MACLDHVCVVCGYAWMDNVLAREPCPQCGGRVTNDFDEDVDDRWDVDASGENDARDDDEDEA